MERTKIYYAHPVGTYGSLQERRDLGRIARAFEEDGVEVEVVNPGDPQVQRDYKAWLKDGMGPDDHEMRFFKALVLGCDGIAYRGETPGVRYEVSKAREAGIPIVQVDRL